MNSPQMAAPAADVIRFPCWSCNTELTVPSHMAGVTGPCPRCGQTLAAPMAPPTMMMPSCHAPEPYSIPATASASSTGGGSGYRSPMPPAPPPLPRDDKKAKEQFNMWWCLMALPPMMLGGNFLARFLGALLGGMALKLCAGFLTKLDSTPKRILSGIGISATTIALFVVTCNVVGLPLKGSINSDEPVQQNRSSAQGTSTGSLIQQLASIRAEVERRKPGFFTEADFRAADAAVLSSTNRDMLAMARLYAETLKARMK